MHTYLPQTHCESRKKGAWLLNVVVIVVVIVVIAAIMFPIFARTHTPESRINCQSNLKSLAVALQVYWGDYDNKLPSSYLVNHSKKWDRADFIEFGTMAGQLPPKAERRTYVEVLYDHIRSKDIMFCPSDPVDQQAPRPQASYWWKLAIDQAWYGDHCEKPCRDESDFIYNADQIILYESLGRHFDDHSDLKNGVMINVAYLDTHVKTIKIRNATSGNSKNCAANSNGAPMYFNFDNRQPRGENNPLPSNVPAKYVDPRRYSDMF